MRLRLLSCVALILSGCFSPDYQNGLSQCGPAGECPEGFSCAADNHCYRDGTQPSDLSVIDQEPPPDLTPACGALQHACSGVCSDNSNVLTCGSSSCTPCPLPANATSTTCDGTSCGFTCDSGFHQCGDGCASDTSVASCGVSCTPCTAPANGSTSCVSGSCTPACDSGYRLCGTTCIADAMPCGSFCGTGHHLCSSMCVLDTDVNNCGTTSAACSPCPTPPSGHGSATCTGSTPACGITCVAGYHLCGGDCVADTNPAFGCGSASCTACASPDGGSAQCVGVPDGGTALMCNTLQPNGVACASGPECNSGICTASQTGLICASVSCASACQVVNAAGTACVTATSGTDPKNDCTASVATCKQDNCNGTTGATACNVPNNTSCGASTCSTGTQTNHVCSAGSCTAPTVSCNGFTCGASTCDTTCNTSTNAGCDATHYCVGGTSCATLLANGQTCTAAFQCANGICAQGQSGLICASVTCPSACSVVNPGGTACVPATSGSDPKSDCTANAATCKQASCNGTTGATSCDVPDNTSCAASTCSGGTQTNHVCTAGSCTAPTVSCSGFTCGATTCNNSCNTSTNVGCDATHYCVGGTSCATLLANGQTCTAAFQCANGFCTQGQSGLICASLACPSACAVVNAAGTTCVAATSGTDPKADCTASFAGCKQAACNGTTGASGCDVPDTTSCGAPTCSGGSETDKVCTGGVCTSPNHTCNGFTCGATTCNTSCNTSTNVGCDGTHYCVGGTSCATLLANGQTCTAAFQCANGFCTQGQSGLICASLACPSACAVVNAAGTTCVAATSGTDPKADCTASFAGCKQAACNGTTGATACDVGNGTTCGNPSCAAGSETDQICTNGSCGSTLPISCNGFSCNGTVCEVNCTVGTDVGCEPNFYCVGGNSCVAKHVGGGGCTANDQCLGGACGTTGTGSHCCSSSCSGGTCGATDCDGTGACVYPSGGPCGMPSCTGATLTGAGSCNGSGGCAPGSMSTCGGNLKCDSGGTMCLMSCGSNDATGDGNCTMNFWCDGAACNPPQAANGPCTRDSQCLSASCNTLTSVCNP